ncbi:MAG: histidine kinase [Sphingobacterium sp.]
MYFCGVKFRFKNAEQKNSIILIVCLLALLLIGGGLLGIIHHKVDRLKKRILIDFADENMLLVKKQLELLQQDLFLTEKKILDQPAFDPKESADSLLVILPVGQMDPVNQRILTLLRTRTINHRLYHIYLDVEKLNAYFAKLNFGRRAYFEIYDDRRLCVYSPDNRKWGKRAGTAVAKQGQIVKSDFLQLDVMVNSYPCNILFVGGEIKVYVLLLSIEEEIQELLTYSILLGVGLMLVTMVLIYFNVMERRKIQQLKLQSLTQENEYTQMRLVQLRQQINPHFLFNTFGSLQYLIGKDNDLAKSFIGKMTKVYRKMLRTDEAEWSSLGEELELAKAYFFLH